MVGLEPTQNSRGYEDVAQNVVFFVYAEYCNKLVTQTKLSIVNFIVTDIYSASSFLNNAMPAFESQALKRKILLHEWYRFNHCSLVAYNPRCTMRSSNLLSKNSYCVGDSEQVVLNSTGSGGNLV